MGLMGRLGKARCVIGLGWLLAAVLGALAAPVAQAHPADVYFQQSVVHLTADGIRVDWLIYPGSMLVPGLWSEVAHPADSGADQDQDELVSPAEAQAWAETQIAHFTGALDATPLTWRLESVRWPSSLIAFQVGEEIISLHLAADWPIELTGRHQLVLRNNYQERFSVYLFEASGEGGVEAGAPEQNRGRFWLDLTFLEAAAPLAAPRNAVETPTSRPPTAANTPAAAIQQTKTVANAPSPPAIPGRERRPVAFLTGLVRTPELSPTFYLLALAAALALGALHALTPGHGKAIVAAYLVGSRGTPRHAVALGGIVTVTHTGSVLALGLLTLAASRFFAPTTLFPILEVISGLLITALGIQLLYQRRYILRFVRPLLTAKPGGRQPERPRPKSSRVVQVQEEITPRKHGLPHNHDYSYLSAETITWRSLLALGVSGGLVPCPDAIAILLVAAAIGRISLGLVLILAFSLGLALVLIGIGLATVRGRSLLEGRRGFNRLAPVLPLASAVVVIGLGASLTLNALRGNAWPAPATASSPPTPAVSQLAPPTAPPTASPTPIPVTPTPSPTATPAFCTGRPALLYLAWDEQRRGQLAIISPFVDKSEPVLLTQEPVDIWDYALAPDGDRVVYTVARPDRGSDLWLVDADFSADDSAEGSSRQLLACPQAACSNASWSADGKLLVYEKRNMPVPGAPPGLPCLWWLDPASGETWPTFEDERWVGLSPRLSPDGQWLSYVSLNSGVLQIYHLRDERNTLIPTYMGEPAVWSPGGDALLLGDVRYIQETAYIHLLRAEPGSGEVVDLSGEARAFDRAPAWSPDGGWIAFVRRDMGTEDAARGQQIWLMRPDGKQAHPLTADPDFNYDGVAWSPDGRYLTFHRTRLTEQWPLPAVCLLEIKTGALRELAAPGYKTSWLP